MKTVKVKLGKNSYEVIIGAGEQSKIGSWLRRKGFTGAPVVITDPLVNQLHGETLRQSLAVHGLSATTLTVPQGEASKTLETAGRLYQELTEARADRMTPIIALGGGVIGDLAGFVAATYLRGVPFIQLPTTLLAQVDSSVGGKVAVDHGQLKNKIGTFYQPALVIADVDTLKTLSEEEFASGLAEVIKTAAIRSQTLFAFLENNLGKLKAREPSALEEVVSQAVMIKAEVVMKDERDMGLRHILNYGHTIGHAIETVSGFSIKHGQAVAIGMVSAAKIAHKKGILSAGDMARLTDVIKRAGLPYVMPGLNVSAVMAAMQHDKKARNGALQFVLLKSIGHAFVTADVSLSMVEQVLAEHEEA